MKCANTTTPTEYEYEIKFWMHEVARRNARNLSRDGGESGDMGRRPADKLKDNYYSILAELAVKSFVEEVGIEDAEHVHDWAEPDDIDSELAETINPVAFDWDIYGAAVDIKMRKTWNYQNPDLIVRASPAGTLDADLYLQVDLDRGRERIEIEHDGTIVSARKATTATIVGFSANFEAAASPHYCPGGVYHPERRHKGTRNFKTLVNRGDLHDVDDLETWALMTRQAREDGEVKTVTNRADYQQFVNTLEANRNEANGEDADGTPA